MKRTIFSLFAAILTVLTAPGQPYCSVKQFNLRDGLPSNVLSSQVQTSDQLLWFATWNGLTCYDGYRFTTYRDVPVDGRPRVLTTNRLLAINTNSAGDIWCITYDLNAYLFSRRSSQYVDIASRINQRFGITFHCARAIALKNGYTWLLSSETGGVAVRVDDRRYDEEDGLEVVSPDDERLGASEIFWAFIDAEGHECVFTDRGVARFDGSFRSDLPFRQVQTVGGITFWGTNDGRISRSEPSASQPKPLAVPAAVKALSRLLAVGDDLLVGGTNAGLYVYDVRRARGRLVSLPAGVDPLKSALTAYVDSRQRLWMGSDGGGIVCVDPSSGQAELLPTGDAMLLLRQSNRTFFHEDRSHTLWAATEQGFFGYYDERERRFVACPLRTSLTQPVVDRWLFDAQGNLWYSGEHNLSMVSFGQRHTVQVTGMTEVRSIMFDHQGRIWAGSLGGDLAIYAADGTLQGYLDSRGRLTSRHVRFSTHIYCLYQDRQQRIWIGTKGDGLYRLDPDGRLVHYALGQLPSNQVYDVHQDQQGRIWVGTFERGICLFQPAEAADGEDDVFLSAPEQLKNYPIDNFHKVRRITETPDGTIIVSASNGLVAFSEHFADPQAIEFHAHKHVPGDSASLMTSDVMQALVTNDRQVYIATVGGGLQTADASSLLSEPLRLHWVSGFSDQGTVLTLLQDLRGNIWMGRENSIGMLHHDTHQHWQFGPNNISEDIEFTEAKPAFNAVTGQIALTTTDGFVLFQPELWQEDSFVPPLVFTGVQLHGRKGTPQMLLNDSLELESDQRNLTIHFAALDYQDNYLINYAYRLEGIDHEWNTLGAEHSITFNNLPPGRHRLLVRSTNSHGAWVDNEHALFIYAHPTFWESGWARLLYVILALLVVGVAIWIYRLYVRNSMERKLNDLKTRFFTDVSHKLRTPLTLIGGPVTQVLESGGLTDTARQHLEMVRRNAHNMLNLVDKMLTYSKEHPTYISPLSTSASNAEDVGTAGTEADGQLPLEQTVTDLDASRPPQATTADERLHLLIVEDNDDLRQFLVSILQSDYDVSAACNGREGLEKAEREQPDFILTDVMMPEMDGLTMVHRIKDNQDISHIPIVILSAKASLDDRIEGLKAGVNDYITKPFSATYLKQRMQNIIQNQRLLQQTILASIKPDMKGVWTEEPAATGEAKTVEPETDLEEGQTLRLKATTIVDTDKQMMEQLLDYIETNLSNSDLRIEDIASALCLGRTVFYNKLKTLVGMSPVELLRHIRIQHAEDMVAKSAMPFSQIAYTVGFSDPRYFGKCFKKQTGLTPSEYRERVANHSD
ncbi:MAG: response regulator [Prevotella sp.]|nr:response regulator [Prevotella sp.]